MTAQDRCPQPDPAPRWLIGTGQQVRVGDRVATDRHPDERGRIDGVGPLGMMRLVIESGPLKDKIRNVWPHEVLLRLNEPPTQRGGEQMGSKDYLEPLRSQPQGEDDDTKPSTPTVPPAEPRE